LSGFQSKLQTPSSVSNAQVNWHEYVQLAWQVDPKLAISLLSHFPMANAARAELEALVVKHAHSTKVRKGCSLCLVSSIKHIFLLVNKKVGYCSWGTACG
jgi:hypothetical protein